MADKKIELRDVATLIAAEETCHLWATQLASSGRDYDAAECLRTEKTILGLRCSLSLDLPSS